MAWSVGSLSLLVQAVVLPAHVASAAPTSALDMAATAMDRLDRDFYSPRLGLYAITGDKLGPSSSLWPTSQVLNAAIQVAALTHAPGDIARVRRIIDSLARYLQGDGVYHTRAFSPARRYTDDNNWIALDLLDAYDLLHDPAYLAGARRLFRYVVANWQSDGGGIVWRSSRPDRPTVSNAPAATIGFRLAAFGDPAYYRGWAERIYAWENAHLRSPSGVYWDHVRPDGTIDTTLWSYNQGVMIQASIAYARSSGDSSYLQAAGRIAAAAAAALAGHLQNHGLRAAFDAIYFQAIGRLDLIHPGAADLSPLRAYVQWAWPVAQAPRPSLLEENLLDQAAFVISAATLAMQPRG